MIELKNELIRASAGTGKTHALVQRYLWLLAHGAEPERIAAMTFTRKAAGEFFERILQELAKRSTEGADQAASLGLLRKVVRRMDQLRLGTIDSFFATMTQCLPFELGLTGKAALMSDEEALQAGEEVMDALLLAVGKMDDPTAMDELREAWKAASHGYEQGRPAEALATWCGRLHQLLIESPHPGLWGGAEAIWPGQPGRLLGGEGSLSEAVQLLQDTLDLKLFGKNAVAKWEEFFTDSRAYDGFRKLSESSIGYMLDPKRGDHSRLRLGDTPWLMWKAATLDLRSGTALADLLDRIIARALGTHVRRTRAQREVVRIYETTYHRLVRARGRLVFSDLAWLLCGRLQATTDGAEDWETLRTALEFRMDAKYDHWLLDEFQDTSERQWEVMAPLLEEARQDPEERRSVFLVGDLKQSIYLWRQAEPELFHHVEEAWQGQRLTIRPLNESYRSCPQVLAMVNGVFDASGPELEELFPGVGGLWQYEKHRCSDKVAGLEGHAAMLKAPEVPEESEDDAVTLAAAALIRDIDPLARGLTCAVLVQSNRTAREISDSLRRLLGMEVICESRESVAVDNPATLALLSLLQLAVHPGDTAAWQHVNMTPLRVSIEAEKLGPALVGARLRSDLAAHGFLAVLQAWSEKLVTAMGEVDSFTERRLAQLLDLAADFDETGSRDVDAFLRSAREHTLREDSATAHAIQVMTVHQSKGLQFDVVILPELQGEPLDTVTRNRLFVSRGKRGVVKWLLDKPEKVIVQREDVLRTEQAREKARQAFEGLCRFYVAMTRAKLGLYALLDPDPHFKGSNEEKLLAKRLGTQNKPTGFAFGEEDGLCVWECGERHWYEAHPRRDEDAVTDGEDETEAVGADAENAPSDFGSLLRQVNRPLERRAPSGEESFVLKGTDLLSTVRESKREFGTRVHELLSAFDWLDDVPDLWAVWRVKGMLLAQPPPASNSEEEETGAEFVIPSDEADPAAHQVVKLLESPEVRTWFLKSGAKASASREAWMERRFDYVEKGGWVSGIIDRVVIERDLLGLPIKATILDFKTDHASTEEELQAKAKGYAPQLALYVPAVARMSGLGVGEIRKALVFTASRRVVEV